MGDPSGVLVVDKPQGPTSHDVVRSVRKRLRTREVGHAGTLDPMATGVLVVAVGEATKLVPYLTAADKSYEATVRLGVGTDTLDAEGAVTEELAVPADLSSRLEEALEGERARTEQVPPAYSAIRVAGERAHELARQGRPPELAPRAVVVRSLELLSATPTELRLRMTVGKGYFVRSLARDLAARIGTAGHLTSLRRTASGAFTLAHASEELMTIERAAALALPSSALTPAGVVAAFHGKLVPASEISALHDGPSAWFDEAGRLVAVGGPALALASGEEVGGEGEAPPPIGGRVLRGFRHAAGATSSSPSRAPA